MVAEQAARHGLPLHTGRVKTDAFRRVFREHWCPDLCIAATFGQRIDAPLFNTPPLGFYNLHPCVQGPWPSPYAGPNPFQALIDDGRDHAVVALHHVDEGFDTGEIVDNGQPMTGPYVICFNNGCMADYEASGELIGKLKKGQGLVIQGINGSNQPISLVVPLADFAKAYDGPPTDPKVFEEQQKKLQDELQRRAEEARKKLEGQQAAPTR